MLPRHRQYHARRGELQVRARYDLVLRLDPNAGSSTAKKPPNQGKPRTSQTVREVDIARETEHADAPDEHFRSGDDRIPCTQAECPHQVLHAENGKEPKGVKYHHERMPVMLG